ncbi:hypothetical protein NMG60_11012625 [Bertholletia excelsa]
MEDSREKDIKPSAANDKTSVRIQSPEKKSISGERVQQPQSAEIKNDSNPEIEELFKGLQWVSPPSDKPVKNVKSDVMSQFEKSCMASPFSAHQQKLSVMAQQQSSLMAAAANSSGVPQTFYGNTHQNGPNGVHFSTQNWKGNGNHISRVMMPMAEVQKHMQMGNIQPSFSAGIAAPYPTPSMYNTRPAAPIGHATVNRARASSSHVMAASTVPVPSGRDYDFSSLTQGMFTKR